MNDILGYMTNTELGVIETLAKCVPENGTIVELGSFFGRSAVTWATFAPTSKVYCVDWFLESLLIGWGDEKEPSFPIKGVTYNVWESFLENTKSYSNIVPIRGKCPVDITYPGDPIDLLFIDLHHHNPEDIDSLNYFIPYMKPNSIISGHDYSDEFPDVKSNVRFLEEKFNTTAIIHKKTSLWEIRISSEKVANTATNRIKSLYEAIPKFITGHFR